MADERCDDFGATLSFDLSHPGRIGVTLPANDVPEAPLPPADLLRDDLPLPELSQLDVVRYFTSLSQRNFSIDTGFYPLGSCSMKYNPKVNERIAALAALVVGGMAMFGALGWVTGAARPRDLKSLYRGAGVD